MQVPLWYIIIIDKKVNYICIHLIAIIGDDIGNKIIKNNVKAWHGKEWSSILSIIGLGLDTPQYVRYVFSTCT